MLFSSSKRLYEQQQILQQIIPQKYQVDSANSYIPRLYHNKHEHHITINKTLNLENFRRRGATPKFCLHVVNIQIIEIVSQTYCFVM
jgi:hypothetical protein